METKNSFVILGLTASLALTACNGAPTMSVSPSTSVVGEDIVVSFSEPIQGKAANLYWIALQSVDSPDSRESGRILVEHGQTSVRIRATEAGSMEVRLHDRYPQKESHIVARVPVRIVATRDAMNEINGVSASTEAECLNQWLATKNLDAYGSPEGSVYGNVSPLFDPTSRRTTPRTTYLYAKFPDLKTACAPASRNPANSDSDSDSGTE